MGVGEPAATAWLKVIDITWSVATPLAEVAGVTDRTESGLGGSVVAVVEVDLGTEGLELDGAEVLLVGAPPPAVTDGPAPATWVFGL